MTRPHPAHDDGIRLNRWFTDQGICSRREADRWIEAGRVSVNGEPAVLGTKVLARDQVALDGRTLERRAPDPIVIAYNKPVGVECTSDPKVPNNLLDAVAYPERLVHIGRLDVMSEGLILLTNRGEIVNRILRSEFEHEKEYLVELSHPIPDGQIDRLSRGIDIGDGRGPTRPCTIERLGPATLRIVLTEGRNRQIRKMAEAIGNHVRRLERLRIMELRLGTLPRGHWRHLSTEELRALFAALHMPEPRGGLRARDTRPVLPSTAVVKVGEHEPPRARHGEHDAARDRHDRHGRHERRGPRDERRPARFGRAGDKPRAPKHHR